MSCIYPITIRFNIMLRYEIQTLYRKLRIHESLKGDFIETLTSRISLHHCTVPRALNLEDHKLLVHVHPELEHDIASSKHMQKLDCIVYIL